LEASTALFPRTRQRIARAFRLDAATAEEIAYAEAAVREHDERRSSITLKIGIGFNLAILALAPLLAYASHRTVLTIAASICVTVDVLWALFGARQRVVKAWAVLFGFNILLIGAFAYAVAIAVRANDESAYALGASTLVALATTLTILSPFSNLLTPLAALAYWLLAVVFYHGRPETPRWLVIYGMALVFACVIRYVEGQRTRRETILSRRSRQAELRAAQIGFQRELELAREIQDSMAPPPVWCAPDGTRVLARQRKHEKVAGDWCATRMLANGTLVLVVVDATGKGMQAALVTHAIQSLWATTLAEATFDPRAWLVRVNVTLLRLGEKQTHSATVGLAVLERTQVTYWSAGHLPLFALVGGAAGTTFKALTSRGNMLGLGPALELTAQSLPLTPGAPLRLLLGSDGVFARGTLTVRREVEAAHARVTSAESAFETALLAPETGDDQTLLVVERDFTAAAVTPAKHVRVA
jgi:hypothetical protein